MQYKVKAKKSTLTDGVKYYPVVALSKEPMKLEAIISEIVEATGVTRPDVKAVIAALRDSKSVRLGDLGSFRPTIEATNGCDKAEEVNTSHIKAVHVRFTPSSYMERKLKPDAEGMSFVKVDDGTTTTTTTDGTE